jgi:hypothetical protein
MGAGSGMRIVETIVQIRRAHFAQKGTCTRGIYDNMRTAVDTVFIGKDRRGGFKMLAGVGSH